MLRFYILAEQYKRHISKSSLSFVKKVRLLSGENQDYLGYAIIADCRIIAKFHLQSIFVKY